MSTMPNVHVTLSDGAEIELSGTEEADGKQSWTWIYTATIDGHRYRAGRNMESSRALTEDDIEKIRAQQVHYLTAWFARLVKGPDGKYQQPLDAAGG